jgi:hypothetical protein
VRGADATTDRPGLAAMLDLVASDGVRTIIVEKPRSVRPRVAGETIYPAANNLAFIVLLKAHFIQGP